MSDVIETGEVPQKYFLSPNAARGDDCGERIRMGQKPISPFKKSFGDPVKGPIVAGLAYCLYACSARHTGTDWSRNYVSYPKGRVRRLVPVECERLQGFPENWTMTMDRAKSFAGDSDEPRYHALGNAVTVPVVEWLGKRIHRYLASKSADVSEDLMSTPGLLASSGIGDSGADDARRVVY